MSHRRRRRRRKVGNWPRRFPKRRLALHAPAPHGEPFNRLKHEVFDQQANDDHGGEAGEYLVRVKLISALKNILAQPALPRGCAEHQFASQ